MSTFAITGMGRCGTMWLSELMNRSEKWQVLHEPNGSGSARFAYQRFYEAHQRGVNYGEVNSRLRWHMRDLPLAFAAVIVRHPMELARSSFNRGWGIEWIWHDLSISMVKLDEYIEHGILSIEASADIVSFKELVSSPTYAQKVCSAAGVDDVTVTNKDCETVVNRNKWYKKLPDDMRREVDKQCGWFIEKYQQYWQ